MVFPLKSRKIGGQQFYLPPNLQPTTVVGKGSYGVVISATDNSTGSRVAVKRIKPYCGDEWEARHTLREVRLMRLLGVHPNVISLTNLWTRDESNDSELYLAMELMDSDLHAIIQSKQQLSEPHFQVLMKQLLLGVQAMHRLGVLHRDLKPGNLLVTKDCQLRITDFGLARAWDAAPRNANDNESSVGAMTEYVVTRWYRCPELLLAPHLPYDGAIDLWSCGCIFAELLNRRPLFPGKSYVHQVQVILDVLGTPASPEALGFAPREDAATFMARQKKRIPVPWKKVFPANTSQPALDLVAALLNWDPTKRLNVSDALAHPWLRGCPALPCEADLSATTLEHHRKAIGVDFKFEDPKTPLPQLRAMVEREVSAFQAQASSNTASNLRPSAPTTVASSNTPAANGNSNMYEMAREKEVARREIRAVAAATAAATAADARADAAARTAATRNQPISSNGGLPPAPDGSGSAPQSPPRAQHEQASQQLLRKKSQEGIAVNGGGGGGGALEAIRRAGSSSSSSSSTLSSNAMRTAAAYTSGRSANGGLLTKTSRSSSRGRRCSSGSGRRGSSGLSGDDTGNNTINHNNSGSSASAAALNGAALNQMKYDELRAAMQNNGGKFGKLESRSGAGGLPPHRTLPQIPPLNSHLSTSGSSGNGSNNTAIMNGSNLNNNNNGSSALVGAGPGGNPRPGSRQMINALRSKSVTAQAQGDQMQQQQQQQLPLARITPRSGRRGSLLGAK